MASKKTVMVRAKERGFDNLVVREPGDEFPMPCDEHGNLPSAPWFDVIDPKAVATVDDLG